MEDPTGGILREVESASDPDDDPTLQGSNERESLVQQARKPNLPSLRIPERSPETAGSSFGRVGPAASSSSTGTGRPPYSNSVIPRSSLKNRMRSGSSESEMTSLMTSDTDPSHGSKSNKPSSSSYFSRNKPSLSSAHSLPATPTASSHPETTQKQDNEIQDCSASKIPRSSSAPAGTVEAGSSGTNSGFRFRQMQSNETDDEDSVLLDTAECRVCLSMLNEREFFKLECSCKGSLAFLHQDCLIKWFRESNRSNCDVCKQEVRNLHEIIQKVPDCETTDATPSTRRSPEVEQQIEVNNQRLCKKVKYLIVFDTIAWFCFLLILLKQSTLEEFSLVLSIGCASPLGFISSIISSIMVSPSYIWPYSIYQLAMVILSTYISKTAYGYGAILSGVLGYVCGLWITVNTVFFFKKYLQLRSMQ